MVHGKSILGRTQKNDSVSAQIIRACLKNQYFEHGSEKKGAVYDRIAILVIGGWLYSKLSVKLLQPSAAPTPVYTRQDGLDFVPMGKARNSLINLLNIAGTGPVLGPIQGILFGPYRFSHHPDRLCSGRCDPRLLVRYDLLAQRGCADARVG